MSSFSASPADFQSTRWSLLVISRDGEEPVARRALESLCRIYWTPLFVFARRNGWTQEDAEDLVQSFFAKSLENRLFFGADPEKGRLRNFLLIAFKRHLIDELRHRSAEKRGGAITTVFVDGEEGDRSGGWQIANFETPEDAYQHRWVCALLEKCFERLREQYLLHNKEAVFEALSPLLTPGTGATINEAVAILNSGEGAVRVALHRLRKAFGNIFLEEIKSTLLPGEDLDDEIKCLMRIVSNRK